MDKNTPSLEAPVHPDPVTTLQQDYMRLLGLDPNFPIVPSGLASGMVMPTPVPERPKTPAPRSASDSLTVLPTPVRPPLGRPSGSGKNLYQPKSRERKSRRGQGSWRGV